MNLEFNLLLLPTLLPITVKVNFFPNHFSITLPFHFIRFLFIKIKFKNVGMQIILCRTVSSVFTLFDTCYDLKKIEQRWNT